MNSKLRFGFLLGLILIATGFGSKTKPLTAQEILDLVNRDRSSHGLATLTLNPTLNLAASEKASDMLTENYFAHTSPSGISPWHWFKTAGYNYSFAGENLAEGYADASVLEKSWMASPSHRANILSPNYSEVGLAVVDYNNSSLVVQLFGGRDNKLTYQK